MPGIFAHSRTNALARQWLSSRNLPWTRVTMRAALRRYWRTSHRCKDVYDPTRTPTPWWK